MTNDITRQSTMTLTAFYHALKQQLSTCSVSPEQSEAEAKQLLFACFALSVTDVMTDGNEPMNSLKGFSEEALHQCAAFVEQRMTQQIPLQYLLKEASFYGLSFKVTPAVLIPRPETELLVERALQEIETRHQEKPEQLIRILDIGTGSGCIAVTLGAVLSAKHPNRSYHITALDISSEAIVIAEENAARHHVDITFLESDVFSALDNEAEFDVILSNPPYVGLDEKKTMQPDVLVHEPHTALFADVVKPEWGRFGFYEQFAREANNYLAPSGIAILEFGTQMKTPLETLFVQAGFLSVEFIKDYAGCDRFVVLGI